MKSSDECEDVVLTALAYLQFRYQCDWHSCRQMERNARYVVRGLALIMADLIARFVLPSYGVGPGCSDFDLLCAARDRNVRRALRDRERYMSAAVLRWLPLPRLWARCFASEALDLLDSLGTWPPSDNDSNVLEILERLRTSRLRYLAESRRGVE